MTAPLALALALALPGPGLPPVLPDLVHEARCGSRAYEVWPDDPRFGRALRELRVPAGRRDDVERVRADREGARAIWRRERCELR